MSCRRSLTKYGMDVRRDILYLNARHGAIMALRAPFRNRATYVASFPMPLLSLDKVRVSALINA